MNSIKSILVTAMLLAIGYGANLFMNHPVGTPEFKNTGTWDLSANGLLRESIPNQSSPVGLPPLQPSHDAAWNQSQSPAGSGTRVPNPFANGARPNDPGSVSYTHLTLPTICSV